MCGPRRAFVSKITNRDPRGTSDPWNGPRTGRRRAWSAVPIGVAGGAELEDGASLLRRRHPRRGAAQSASWWQHRSRSRQLGRPASRMHEEIGRRDEPMMMVCGDRASRQGVVLEPPRPGPVRGISAGRERTEKPGQPVPAPGNRRPRRRRPRGSARLPRGDGALPLLGGGHRSALSGRRCEPSAAASLCPPAGYPDECGPYGPVPEASVGWTAIVPMNLGDVGGTELVGYAAAPGWRRIVPM